MKYLHKTFKDWLRWYKAQQVWKPLNTGRKRTYNCECGKTYEVWTGVYSTSDTGCGSCECRKCTTYIN